MSCRDSFNISSTDCLCCSATQQDSAMPWLAILRPFSFLYKLPEKIRLWVLECSDTSICTRGIKWVPSTVREFIAGQNR